MNVPKLVLACSLPLFGLSGCLTNDPYGQQEGGYGEYGAYGQGGSYGQGAPSADGQAGYGNPYGGGYAPDYASESGDVVSIPGDGPPSYGSSPSPDTGAYGHGYGSSYDTGSSASGGRTYTVKSGDNLYRIAKAHEGVSMQDIIQHNGLQSTTIYPGQQLIIPGVAGN